jgi:uncharacterized protein YkwD
VVKTWVRCSAFALALALSLSSTSSSRAQTGSAGWGPEDWLSLFSRERARLGAPPLLEAPVLDQVAQQQAEAMVRGGRRPKSPSTATVSTWLRQVGYSAHDWREYYSFSDSAPLASRAPDIPDALPRVVRDERFRDVGVGTARADGVVLQVFLFGWHEGDYFAAATARLADRARVAAEMRQRVNEVRRRAGLPPLVPNPLLDRISQEHAEDMLLRSYFGHRTPEGLGPSERARADGYRPGIGENLVEQRFSTEEAFAAWLDSAPHRRNILDPDSRELGLGLAVGAGYDAAPGGYRVVWVQSFGRGE